MMELDTFTFIVLGTCGIVKHSNLHMNSVLSSGKVVYCTLPREIGPQEMPNIPSQNRLSQYGIS